MSSILLEKYFKVQFLEISEQTRSPLPKNNNNNDSGLRSPSPPYSSESVCTDKETWVILEWTQSSHFTNDKR